MIFRVLPIVLALLIAAAGGAQRLLAQTPPALVTRGFDNQRSGGNVFETKLTVANVSGLRRITTIPVTGDARGMEAQPLILPGVSVGGGVHNVMVLASMANIVRGVEAADGAQLWTTDLAAQQPACHAINSTPQIDMHGINEHWGILSTGVIDPETQRVYLVAWCSPDGTMARAMHYIYTLDIADGRIAAPPVSLALVTDGSQYFNATARKQRTSLVMTNIRGVKTIFFGCGAVLESPNVPAGWIIAFDPVSNRVSAALSLSQGTGAGIWMAGQGMAADSQGDLYAVTGNGSYNGVTDFGESVIKVRYQPANATGTASLKVIDSWSPFSDSSRLGLNPALTQPTVPLRLGKVAGISAPSDPVGGSMDMPRKTRTVTTTDERGNTVPLVYPVRTGKDGRWGDEDFGSAGGTLIEKYGVYFAAGKDGIGYAVNSTSLGHTQPADFNNMKANCAKLKSPPAWVAASPGPVDPCPQDTTTLDFFPWGRTRHIHATPVQYWSPTRGLTLFVWGENSQLHAWTMDPTGRLTYLAQGSETASAQAPVSNGQFGGMPGGFCTLSSNGNQPGTSLLWCTISYGDANATVTNGRLLCYDPENLITNADGSRTLRVLWDSEQAAIPFIFNKFDPPVVWNGQVYVPNYAGGVEVFGPGQLNYVQPQE